ncbi:hypothetical protein A7L06_18405 [Acinetobacter baumannii]|nr:hypothetical protein A7L06_18405 [Acinetobacter baumannii]
MLCFGLPSLFAHTSILFAPKICRAVGVIVGAVLAAAAAVAARGAKEPSTFLLVRRQWRRPYLHPRLLTWGILRVLLLCRERVGAALLAVASVDPTVPATLAIANEY